MRRLRPRRSWDRLRARPSLRCGWRRGIRETWFHPSSGARSAPIARCCCRRLPCPCRRAEPRPGTRCAWGAPLQQVRGLPRPSMRATSISSVRARCSCARRWSSRCVSRSRCLRRLALRCLLARSARSCARFRLRRRTLLPIRRSCVDSNGLRGWDGWAMQRRPMHARLPRNFPGWSRAPRSGACGSMCCSTRSRTSPTAPRDARWSRSCAPSAARSRAGRSSSSAWPVPCARPTACMRGCSSRCSRARHASRLQRRCSGFVRRGSSRSSRST